MNAAQGLAVLRAASGRPQRKHHTALPTGTIASSTVANESLWRYSTREAATIGELARVLRELTDDETAVLLRDAPRAGVDTSGPIHRRAVLFEDVPRAWMMIDVDNLVAPHLDVVDEPELAAHFIRDELATYAPELEGVAMFIAWSGSCGIRDRSTLKAHVVVMLDTPTTSGELLRWARVVNARTPGGRGLVDEALYRRVQIHFIARPRCTGFPDPFPGGRRFVMLSGAPTATLDIPAHHAQRTTRSPGDVPLGDVRGFDARLARIGAAGIHNEALAAIGAAVRELGADRAEASRAEILARVAARICETRDQERADHHVAQLNGMFSRVIERQRATDAGATRAAPTYSPRGSPLDVAQTRTANAVDGFVRLARDRKARLVADAQDRRLAAKLAKAAGVAQEQVPPIEMALPPVHAIRVDAGTGKTAAIVARIARDRREGAVEHRLRVAYLVPLHRLGDQLVDDLRAAGVFAQLWRGLMSDDPEEPGEKMCQQTALAEAALGLGALDVACRVCPSSASCGYMRQKERPPADVEVAAHNFLFSEGAPRGLRSCDAIVVDEGFWSHALEGTGEGDDAPTKLLISTLDAEPTGLAVPAAVDLSAMRARLRRAIARAIEAGELRRAHLLDEGLALDDINTAIRLEWQRKPDVRLDGDVPVAEMIERLATLRRASAFTRALPGLWAALKRWLVTDVEVAGAIEPVRELRVGRAGSGPGVRFARRRDVAAWAQGMPILLADATMPVPVVREILPRIEVVADVEVLRPAWVRHHQLAEPLPGAALVEVDDEGVVRAKHKLRDVADRVELLARQAEGQGRDGCDVLVGSTIDVEGALRGLLSERGLDVAPPTGATRRHAIELAHFGAVEGSNAFAGVRHVVVVGWSLPPAGAMERQARALTGAVPQGEVGASGYPMAPGGIALRDGTGRAVEAPRHPDQLVEAMRWAATEGRMVQLADRARGVRRGPEAPLDVWLLSPLPLPGMPADRLLSWADVEVSRLALAFWRGGRVLPLRAEDLARTGSWPTANAAARAVERERTHSAFRDSILKGLWVLSAARYRRPGQRAWSPALADPALPPARIVELLRAATGVPDLVVALGAADPQAAGRAHDLPAPVELPVEDLEVADPELDLPTTPPPLASSGVAQAVPPPVLASPRPIVFATAWGQASGSSAVAGRALAVSAMLVPGRAYTAAPLVLGGGPYRAHHVPARGVFACRSCAPVELVPPPWMVAPAGEGSSLML